MFNLDDMTDENDKEHNKKWPYLSNHPYKILIIGDCGSRKTNALFNWISQQGNIDKIYLHAKDLIEPRYEFLIKRKEDEGMKYLNDSKAFIDCSNTTDDVHNDINEYNPTRKRKNLIFLMWLQTLWIIIKLQAVVKELFNRCRKLNISLALLHIFLNILIFLFQKNSN